jgi:hypothetical protein
VSNIETDLNFRSVMKSIIMNLVERKNRTEETAIPVLSKNSVYESLIGNESKESNIHR